MAVQTEAARLLDKLTSHGKSTCAEQLHACAIQCLPVLRPLVDDKAAEVSQVSSHRQKHGIQMCWMKMCSILVPTQWSTQP